MSLIQCEMALNRNCKTPESKSIKADSNWEVAFSCICELVKVYRN